MPRHCTEASGTLAVTVMFNLLQPTDRRRRDLDDDAALGLLADRHHNLTIAADSVRVLRDAYPALLVNKAQNLGTAQGRGSTRRPGNGRGTLVARSKARSRHAWCHVQELRVKRRGGSPVTPSPIMDVPCDYHQDVQRGGPANAEAEQGGPDMIMQSANGVRQHDHAWLDSPQPSS